MVLILIFNSPPLSLNWLVHEAGKYDGTVIKCFQINFDSPQIYQADVEFLSYFKQYLFSQNIVFKNLFISEFKS
jgi:hypothetical protein